MRKYLSLSFIFFCALMAVCLEATGAPVSSQTQPVKGHAPVVTGVGITGPGTPVTGDTLRLGGTFSDPDGDAESGSLLQWYHSDGTPVATGQEYVIQAADAGKRIQAGYTPKTDPALTDPDTGTEVKSALTLLIMGKPDGGKSAFTRDRGMIAATGTDKAILTLTLKDSAGNPVSGIAGRLSLAHVPTVGTDTVSLTTDDRGNGVYEFSVTGTQPGTVVFTPQMDGADLATMPATQTLVLTGDSSTAQITEYDLTVTRDNAVADDSDTTEVQAQVIDDAGRPVAGVTVSFSTVAPAHVTVSSGVTDINGIATASVASPASGSVAVTAKITSTGSEQTVNVNFMAGAPATANSTLAVSHASITANGGGTGGTSSVTLTLKDANNNPVTGRTDVAFTVSGVTGTTLTAVTESPAGSGIYSAMLSGTTSGTATLGTTLGGSVFSPTPATAGVILTPDLSTAVVSTLTLNTPAGVAADNATTQTLTATVKDANGNPVSGATVNWSVTTGSATLSAATSITDASGMAQIDVKDTTAETATVQAKVGTNAADTGKTAEPVFTLYPVVSRITAGTNNSLADGVTQNTLMVQVSDLAGNAINNQNVTLNFAGTDLKTGPATLKAGATVLTAGSAAVPVTTDGNGQVLLTATNITAETITVSAAVSNGSVPQTQSSTFSVYPVISAADISVPLDGAPSDAASLNTVQVIVRDLKGNPLSGQTVSWTMSSPSGKALFSPSAATTATSMTNADGMATVSLTDRRMESVTVTAKTGSGLPVQTQSKATTFMQYANLTITSLGNNNCAVTCTVTVNMNAKDIDGNPLVNLRVGSHSAAYGGGSIGFTLPFTDAAGNATILRPMTTAAVDTGVYVFADAAHNAGVISATRSGAFTREYRSATTTVTTINPVTVTGVSPVINTYTFAANSGFPKTGFAGAKFKITLSDNNPTAYQWAVNGVDNGTAYTSVAADGTVTLISGHSGAQAVQVKSKSTGAVLASYTFTQNWWFTNAGSMQFTRIAAEAYCSPPRRIASGGNISTITPGVSANGVRGVTGKLHSEWGAPSAHTGSGFVLSSFYWMRESLYGYPGVMYPDSGYVSGNTADDAEMNLTMCELAL
ncbi:Ig-like domain-containing protein [Citrobacter meridianamericanus]